MSLDLSPSLEEKNQLLCNFATKWLRARRGKPGERTQTPLEISCKVNWHVARGYTPEQGEEVLDLMADDWLGETESNKCLIVRLCTWVRSILWHSWCLDWTVLTNQRISISPRPWNLEWCRCCCSCWTPFYFLGPVCGELVRSMTFGEKILLLLTQFQHVTVIYNPDLQWNKNVIYNIYFTLHSRYILLIRKF